MAYSLFFFRFALFLYFVFFWVFFLFEIAFLFIQFRFSFGINNVGNIVNWLDVKSDRHEK